MPYKLGMVLCLFGFHDYVWERESDGVWGIWIWIGSCKRCGERRIGK